jgi:hypothetical protein
MAEDRMVAAIGTYNAAAPLASGAWIVQMVAFRTPAGPVPAISRRPGRSRLYLSCAGAPLQVCVLYHLASAISIDQALNTL